MANPGVVALDRLVEMGVFMKGQPHPLAQVQYTATRTPTKRDWPNAAGLVFTAARWVGTRGLSAMRGRTADEVVFVYNPKEDGQ